MDMHMHTCTHGPRCDKPPVVALHGGPSMTHLSLKPLVLLADEGHPVILYDQVRVRVRVRVRVYP